MDDTVEGSADSSYGVKYGQDDDDDVEGSGRDDFEPEDSREDQTAIEKDVINVVNIFIFKSIKCY